MVLACAVGGVFVHQRNSGLLELSCDGFLGKILLGD